MTFWDRVQRGVGQAAKEAQKQATIAKLNLDITGVKGDIRKKVEATGDVTLKLYRDGELTHAAIAGLVEEISALEGRIQELEKQIAQVRSSGS